LSGDAPTVRLAIVDTDTAFTRVLVKRLERAGWQYRVLPGPVPVERIAGMKLSALLVDVTILGPDAWHFLERVCTTLPGLGVIVCTTGSTVAERVRGLRLGADDWIAKPCHPEEVLARVEATARRRRLRSPTADSAPIVAGELEVRPALFQAFVGDQGLDLTRREFELLLLLAQNDGRALEREEIYRRVWGYEMVHGDRSVDVFIGKLRAKLQSRSPGWGYIHTHFGVGYRFDAIADEDRPLRAVPDERPETAPRRVAAGDSSAS
jgi:DNA-binding response OmpR family regulator